MRLLVTAGGTREPIDAARVIANTSTGRLGARIAEQAVEAGYDVVLLHGIHAVKPRAAVHLSAEFDTSADLARLLELHVPAADVVVHAAAVADYLPSCAPGKLASNLDELVLRLRRAPKLVDLLRGLSPRGVLVGFKLTSGIAPEAQIAVAEALRRRAALDLVVANDAARTGEADHEAVLVDASGVVARCTGKTRIAEELVRIVARLAGREAAAT